MAYSESSAIQPNQQLAKRIEYGNTTEDMVIEGGLL